MERGGDSEGGLTVSPDTKRWQQPLNTPFMQPISRRGVRPAFILVVVFALVLTLFFLYPVGTVSGPSITSTTRTALTRALGASSPASHVLKPRDATLIVRSRRVLGGAREHHAQESAAAEVVGVEREEPEAQAGDAPPPPPPPPPPSAGVPASAPAPALVPASASPLRTVGELISEVHPLYPYPSTRPFSVVLSTTWFTGDMPYYTGSHTCPASGCRINLYNRGGSDPSKADMLLYHLRPGDFHGEDSIAPPARGGQQLVGFMLAEGFNAADLPSTLYDKFNTEHSFRATSLVRDTYVLWFLNDAHKQGITHPQRPLSLDARVWQDIWEPPLPLAQRSKKYLASWGSHYCKGARSGREDLVRALLDAGLPLAVFGEDANCLRNVGPELLALGRGDQFKVMREHKFYLSFENHRLEGYVSEKVRWAPVWEKSVLDFV
jgi:hypothetical protein